jgi:excisionase family DNA binding protein
MDKQISNTTPRLISVKGAARELGIGRDSAYALVREGRLPAVRVGRRILVPVAQLDEYVSSELRRNEQPTVPPRTSD